MVTPDGSERRAFLNQGKEMTITGKVIKKEKKKSPVKVELLVEDETGAIYSLQVRPKNVIKLVEIDTGCRVQIKCTNELGKSETNRINNLIVEDIIKV